VKQQRAFETDEINFMDGMTEKRIDHSPTDGAKHAIRPEVLSALEKHKFKRSICSSSIPKNEKGFCWWCGGKLPSNRRKWCSKTCTDEILIRTTPNHAAYLVFQRDKGICSKCGIDTIWLYQEMLKIKYLRKHIGDVFDYKHFGCWVTHNHQLWEADHIIPVVEGGGCCGLEGYQTLCLKCHKLDTAELAKRLANKKKIDKEARKGQLTLLEQPHE
jgi:5-methylcytosine-specific restriction enzyme A